LFVGFTRVRSRNLTSVSQLHICCRHVSSLGYDSGGFDGLLTSVSHLHICCRHVSPLVDNSGDFDRLERPCLVMKGEKRSFVVGHFDCLLFILELEVVICRVFLICTYIAAMSLP
jgi:hypothetical protein